MSKSFYKRARALLVSAVMAASSVAVCVSSSSLVLAASSKVVTIGKTLETSISNAEDPDHPTNEKNCTYLCKAATDEWTSFTDTSGTSPEDLLGTSSVTTLQFNLKAEQMVTDFSYYFGISADKSHSYWWDTNSTTSDGQAVKCTPYASEFSVVVSIPSYADLTGKFQFQNCYTGLIDEEDQSTRTQDASIELVSITVNGTTDTSNGEAPDWVNYVELEGGAENTGGWYYSSINGNSDSYSVETNGDTCTVTTLNSLKIDDLSYELAIGDNASEEYYTSEEFAESNGGQTLNSESAIREAGMPLNSHKFTYQDFNFLPGQTVATNAKPKSLSVTLKLDDSSASLSRIKYGGGLNVAYKSLADTEYAKMLAGVKTDPNAGYWYNDAGGNVIQECEAAGVVWGNGEGDFEVGGGSDLAKQEVGGYVTVTWDIPEQVVDCVTTKPTDQISFQLWYAELVEGTFESATIVDATLTYEETISFPYSGTATVKNAGSNSVGTATKIPYADFNMSYEKTADVYAVQFDVTTSEDANQVQVGAGTSVLEKLGLEDNWLQTDDIFVSDSGAQVSHPVLLYWEKSTVDSRPDASDDSIEVAPYTAPTGTKTYTYMWIIPPSVAEGITTDTASGSAKSAWNNVNAEEEGSSLSMGVWYANLGETTSKTYTLSNVTVYYAADDTNNSAKTSKFEDELSVVDEIDVPLGGDETISVNVEGCAVTSSNRQIATGKMDGTDISIHGANVGTATLTVTTPGGQIAEVTVNVVADKLSVDGNVVEVAVGETEELSVNLEDCEVSSADPSVATATIDGSTITITGVAEGETVVTVTAPDGQTEEITVTVTGGTTTAVTTTSGDKTTTTTSKTTTSTKTTTTSKVDFKLLYGDVNMDGSVDLTDAVVLNKAAAGAVDLNQYQKQNADCNADGEVNQSDAVVLMKFLVALLKSLPETE